MGLRFCFVLVLFILSLSIVFGDEQRVLVGNFGEDERSQGKFSIIIEEKTRTDMFQVQRANQATDRIIQSAKVSSIQTSSNRQVLHVTEEEYEQIMQSDFYDVFPVKIYQKYMNDVHGVVDSNITWQISINNQNMTGNDQSACVIDTGIKPDNPALEENIIAQKCFCSATSNGGDSRGNCCPNNENEDDFADDDDGHGTHVSGIIAANNQIRGIAPNSNIVAVRAGDEIGFTNLDLDNSINWCIENRELYNISVISMSLGGGFYSEECSGDSLNTVIQNAINQNISVVIATGNDNNHTHIGSPACVPNVIRVTSSTKQDELSHFSNRNSLVNLIAPGTSIYSTYHTSPYATMSGTSMATPVVSGAILLLNQYLAQTNQHKTPEEILNILTQTGTPIFDSASNRNYSRINIFEAIQLLLPKLESNITLTQNQTTLFVNITASGDDFYNYTFLYKNDSEFQIRNQSNVSIENKEIFRLNKSDLFEGQTVKFQLIVRNNNNFQSIANANYTRPIATPPNISNLNATQITNSSILINWTNPDSDLFNFSLLYLNGINIHNTTNESYNITNLHSQTEYNITLFTARNETIINTNPVTKIIQTLSNPLPNAISNLNVINITSTSITWNWTNPIDNFNKTLLYLNDTNIINLTNTQNNYTAENLLPNTKYNLTILTANSFGNINVTAVSNITQTAFANAPTFLNIITSYNITQKLKPIQINITLFDIFEITNVTIHNQQLTNTSFYNWTGFIPAKNNFTIIVTNIYGAQNTTILNHTIDNTPPNTTANFTIDNLKINNSQWQNQTVLVTLNATDNTQITKTQYRFDNQSWQMYTEPFNVTKRIANDRISIRSIDIAGNVEQTKNFDLKIDTSQPVITIQNSSQLITGKNGTIIVDFNISGISTEITNQTIIKENISYSKTNVDELFSISYKLLTEQELIGNHSMNFTIKTLGGIGKTIEFNYTIQNQTPILIFELQNNSYLPNVENINTSTFNVQTEVHNIVFNESYYITNNTRINITQNNFWLDIQSEKLDIFLTNGIENLTKNYTFLIDSKPPFISVNDIDKNVTEIVRGNGTLFDNNNQGTYQNGILFILLTLNESYIPFTNLKLDVQTFEFSFDIDTRLFDSGEYVFNITAHDYYANANSTNLTIHINHSKTTTVQTQNTVAFFDETQLKNSIEKITGLSSQNVSLTIQPLKKIQKNITNNKTLQELKLFTINATTFANATIYAYSNFNLTNASIYYDEYKNQSFTKKIPLTIIETEDEITYFSFQTNTFSQFLLANELPQDENSDDNSDNDGSNDDSSSNDNSGSSGGSVIGVASVFNYTPPQEETDRNTNDSVTNQINQTNQSKIQNRTQKDTTQTIEIEEEEPIQYLPIIGITLVSILLFGLILFFVLRKNKTKSSLSEDLKSLKSLENKIHNEISRLKK